MDSDNLGAAWSGLRTSPPASDLELVPTTRDEALEAITDRGAV
jgi:hypothetical protein